MRVQGASSSAQALLLARYAQRLARPVVVLCPTDDAAADLAADLECLSALTERAPLPVWQLPTWEQSAYSPIAPSIRVRLARLAALGALTWEKGPAVIMTTLAAACQATLPPATFREATLDLKVDQSLASRERLIARLLDHGYLRVDTVEDPGTFAIRGEIVDLFPPQLSRPVRLELFDDVIEKIRFFDPATQRTSADAITELRVLPAREVLVNATTTPRIREQLKERADDLAVHRSLRDPVLASVQNGNHPDHSDGWAPFAYEAPGRLWDYLTEGSPVVWSDELGTLQAWDEFREEQHRLASDAPAAGLILPDPEVLFGWNAAIERRVRSLSRLYLDRIQLADLESVEQEKADAVVDAPEDSEEKLSLRHRVFVRENSDLGAGSRHSLEALEPRFRLWKRQGFSVVALASTQGQLERIRFLLEERNLTCRIRDAGSENALEPSVIHLALGSLSEGFRWPAEGLVVVTESEILGTRHQRGPRRSARSSGSASKDWAGLQALSDLAVGDFVVHVDHGIGRYQGLVRLDLSGAPSDFLLLEYANKDRLYLPVYRLNVVQKYVGAGESVALDRLGSQQFAKTKEKVKDSVKKLAVDLVQLYAQRKIRPGFRFSPRDGLFREFEARFPFDETPDQTKAIDDIMSDLESGKVSDRLVCGDVGYGKTEVAMRAAFRAVTDGKQVAVLVPTTVLAFQHEQSFKTRFKDYPITIESISRFKTPKEQKSILESLASGKLDIVIGTHRLFSRDVKFNDLGLIIVDEEHRFGVEHKERLKALKVDTHVVTLTATPIPRTLHMALSGLRDISLINTAPVDRLPIRTYVSKFDDSLIQRALEFELGRGGQVFFLHNRVQSIAEMGKRLSELVPKARITIAHGQMGEGELEKKMLEFYRKQSDILLCTTIIESGLDVPSANTIIINRADQLGLAQLYQIRGRVGRSQQRAYAYLLIPAEGAVSGDAKRRLEVIQRFVELGSGFSIASHDLEIRGGGDLLGPQQSGHIAAVGFDLYTELLEEAIRELEGKPLEDPEQSRREPEIKAPFPAFLAEEYVPDIHQRLSLYRRFSAAASEPELDRLEEELKDRFGALPLEAQNLLWMIRVKILLKRLGIDVLTVGPEKVSLVPGPVSRLDPVRAIAILSSRPDQLQLLPDSKLVARVPTGNLRDLYFGLEKLFKDLT
ncbi:MAG: transcription-repair coupling factor [Oligoflexia bacterium]|nr:transcription-repair coupling factor [Oligoflexia bacterium]